MSRSVLVGADGVGAHTETLACERPPRLRHEGGLRKNFVDAAASPPLEEGNISPTSKYGAEKPANGPLDSGREFLSQQIQHVAHGALEAHDSRSSYDVMTDIQLHDLRNSSNRAHVPIRQAMAGKDLQLFGMR
jgi:hypothetical protein